MKYDGISYSFRQAYKKILVIWFGEACVRTEMRDSLPMDKDSVMSS